MKNDDKDLLRQVVRNAASWPKDYAIARISILYGFKPQTVRKYWEAINESK